MSPYYDIIIARTPPPLKRGVDNAGLLGGGSRELGDSGGTFGLC